MAEWILIITMTMGSNGFVRESYPTPVVHHVPGFASQQACTNALKMWMKDANKINTKHEVVRKSVICVPSKQQ